MNYVMRILSVILVIIAIGMFVTEMASAESAPQQAVAAGNACFIAILARLAQASGHHFDKAERN